MSADKITRADDHSATVLVIEAEPLMLTAMASVMNMNGYRAVMAKTEQIALEAINGEEREAFDLIVLSIDELEAGCAFAARLRQQAHTRDVPIVFVVPELNPTWSTRLGQLGGVYSLLKPFEPEALIELVQKTLWMPHIAASKLGKTASAKARQRDWISLDD